MLFGDASSVLPGEPMAKKAKKATKRAAKKAAKKPARKPARRAVKKVAKKTAKKTAKKSGSKKRTANAAFMRPVTPSATLAAVVGDKPLPRTEVTKRLWAYIKKNGLQDQKNRRMINADGPLQAIFGGRSSVNMFEMTRLVGRHLT
jgi:chromatin remodeling complex protein RSC6